MCCCARAWPHGVLTRDSIDRLRELTLSLSLSLFHATYMSGIETALGDVVICAGPGLAS
jgi:hypothetical protein